MAQSKNNIVTHGLSGKVGDLLVFSQRNGKTVVSTAPKESTVAPTAKQVQQRQKFQQAVLYAKTALASAATREMYAEAAHTDPDKPSAYNIAVADMLHAPHIEKIDLSAYSGKKNDLIHITATDDFLVKHVTVTIENADGTLVEEGNAVEKDGVWEYKATANNADLSGDKITIRAYDMPDNMAEKSQNL